MTNAFSFVVEWIGKMYQFGASKTFEFFGYQVSVFHLMAGFAILYAIFKFLTFFVVPTETAIGRMNMRRGENRKDKMRQQRELKAIKNGARHVQVSNGRHSRVYFDALEKGSKK